MAKRNYAVLIADVVGSRARRDLRAVLGKKLSAVSRTHLKRGWIRLPYSITAGDEFQTILSDRRQASEVILDLRVKLRPLQVRIGIGLGAIVGRVRAPVNRISGPAFQHARSAIESIQRGAEFKFGVLTAFRSRNREFNSLANLIYGLHDTLLARVKAKQWQAIAAYRATRRLEGAARLLDLDVSTVSRNLQRGYFWQMEQTARGVRALLQRAVF